MIFEMLNLLLGIIKVILYKIFYVSRISFDSIPKVYSNFRFSVKKGSKLKLGKNFKTRNDLTIRIYNNGIVKIGDNCFLNDNCSLNCRKSIEIGNNVIFGQNVLIFDHDHDYKNNINEFIIDNIKIGNNVWIGANVVILKGVVIGDNVVIAAGTIVRRNIASNSVVYQKREDVIVNRK